MKPFVNEFSYRIYKQKYSKDGKEEWEDTCSRVARAIGYQDILPYMATRKFIPGGRYLYAAGRPFHQVNNCFLFRAEDSREGWADLMSKATGALMTGGGIGVDYSAVRAEGAIIGRTGGQSTGPLALMHMVNEAGRFIMQGGQRRSAIWAGLNWDHPDIDKFLTLKDWSPEARALKEKDFNFPMPMELTNISVIYDTYFFLAMQRRVGSKRTWKLAKEVWLKNCEQAFRTAEPGMSFNYENSRESLRNACCEVVSEDDSDKCNLGTVWMNHVRDLDEFKEVLRHATRFLMHGAIYSDLPNDRIRAVGSRNNRIGVGLGGIHEWLMARGMPYEVTPELREWLQAYKDVTDQEAADYAKVLGVAEPKGKRAIAPTGSIGILAESTTGIEPLFCKAYLRRYFRDGSWQEETVIDGTVKRLVQNGVSMDAIQDSYDISFEDRVRFQADVQDYVDMAISSTCNMPAWGSPENNESNVKEKADILLKYATRLRGFTCYPDGARGGQPLTRIDIADALKREGAVVEASLDVCDISKGGSCGT